ncbi:IclR family transcriptional regulator [Thermovenabulum gondwanense]|uniref:Transcriptional regulator KdgR n=1 Tax=Thermovenabulum gondwanense TaxID=520767 RepID=A0A161PUT7_9FIRM|nr:IclR family transcriptional regulator [Thermovenabulum gondwanense]KYO63800.1 Transcriptional regulator KdgR [Thermovenabulum gondwanense]
MENKNLVKSVIKALEIIELLNVEGELSIKEISTKLELEKTTVHRLITTLKEKGYVIQNDKDRRYSNSFKLFELGNRTIERLGLRRQAQPYLEELAEKSHETVNLAILDGKYVMYIDKIESSETIKVALEIGKKLPCYCTGLGKAILAYMSEQKVLELLKSEPLKEFTPNTITDLSKLMRELRKIREQGYSVDNEEYVQGLICVASPIINKQGEPIAAMSIAIPKYRIEEGKKDLDYFASLVKETAQKFSKELWSFSKPPLTNKNR